MSKFLHQIVVKVDSYYACKSESFVIGKLGGLEGVPCEDEPFGKRIEVLLPLHRGQLMEAPLLHFPACNFQNVLRCSLVGIVVVLNEEFLRAFLRLRFRSRHSPFDRPVAGELLEGGTKTGEVEIHPFNTCILKVLNAASHCVFYSWLKIFPKQNLIIIGAFWTRSTYQKNCRISRCFIFHL